MEVRLERGSYIVWNQLAGASGHPQPLSETYAIRAEPNLTTPLPWGHFLTQAP